MPSNSEIFDYVSEVLWEIDQEVAEIQYTMTEDTETTSRRLMAEVEGIRVQMMAKMEERHGATYDTFKLVNAVFESHQRNIQHLATMIDDQESRIATLEAQQQQFLPFVEKMKELEAKIEMLEHAGTDPIGPRKAHTETKDVALVPKTKAKTKTTTKTKDVALVPKTKTKAKKKTTSMDTKTKKTSMDTKTKTTSMDSKTKTTPMDTKTKSLSLVPKTK